MTKWMKTKETNWFKRRISTLKLLRGRIWVESITKIKLKWSKTCCNLIQLSQKKTRNDFYLICLYKIKCVQNASSITSFSHRASTLTPSPHWDLTYLIAFDTTNLHSLTFCLKWSLRILMPASVRTNSGFIFLIKSSDCLSMNSFGEPHALKSFSSSSLQRPVAY